MTENKQPCSQATGPKPYIFSKGSAVKHVGYMEKYLGGKCSFKMMRADNASILEHASVIVNGGPVYVSDRYESQYGSPPANSPSSQNTQLYLGFDTHADGEKAWKMAVTKGAEGTRVIMPFSRQAWGSYYGVFEDPFAAVWSVCCPDSAAAVPHGTTDKSESNLIATKEKKSSVKKVATPAKKASVKKAVSTKETKGTKRKM